jgi:hypothetical protein
LPRGQGKLMRAHALESVAPDNSVKEPSGQLSHAVSEVAPTCAPYLPMGHGSQPDRDCPEDTE